MFSKPKNYESIFFSLQRTFASQVLVKMEDYVITISKVLDMNVFVMDHTMEKIAKIRSMKVRYLYYMPEQG